ncbi:MAG: hypothetical protein H8K03_09350 [Nitrospira sp.]
MRNKSIYLFCLVFTLSGCMQNVSGPASPMLIQDSPTTSIFMSPTCKATTEAFPVILVPLVVELGKEAVKSGFSLIQKRLDKIKDEHVASYSAVFSGEFFKVAERTGDTVLLEPNYRCITVVRGNFGAVQKDTPIVGGWDQARLEVFGLRSRPSFIFEGTLDLAGDNKHFKISPIYLEVNDALAKRGKDRKTITVRLALVKPAISVETALQDPLGISSVQFIDFAIPGKRDKTQISRSDTLWYSIPPSEVPTATMPDLRKNSTLAPFSLIVTIVEESDPTDLWNFTTSVVRSALPKAQDVLIGLIGRIGEDTSGQPSAK